MIPLRETKGNEVLSMPLASIKIISYCCQLDAEKKAFTQGTYRVEKVFDVNDDTIHFEGFERIT